MTPTEKTIRIAVVQAESSPADPQENVRILRTFAQQAAHAGCRAVCFPECFLTGYDPDHAGEKAIPSDSPVLRAVSETAKDLQIDILTGYMECSDASLQPAEPAKRSFFITHAVFYTDGRILPYHKTHLGAKEQKIFAPGDALMVFPLSCGLTAGFQVCVECHFPEITQTLSLQGAHVVFVPAASPGSAADRERIWKTIIPARAYDNRVYLACCNLIRKSDPSDKPSLPGGCIVCGPEGDFLAEDFGEMSGVTVFEVDPALLARFRSGDDSMRYRYYPGKRRPELYTAQQPVAFLFPWDRV